MAERPVRSVPVAVLATLAAALAAQVAIKSLVPAPVARAEDLPGAPPAAVLRLASLGEPVALAKAMMLYLQAFDYRAGTEVPYRELDYARVEAWLERMLELDPTAQYPLLAASRLYAEVPDVAKQRRMLEFVYRQFFLDPNRRWPWLAHAASLAKHRLRDLPLARRYAHAIQRHATGPGVPLWARQMEIFILEDMNELQAARIMLKGHLDSGQIVDANELAFLRSKLRQLEKSITSKNQ